MANNQTIKPSNNLHSVRNDFTGFDTAALIDRKLTVSKVITKTPSAVTAKIHHDSSVLYE